MSEKASITIKPDVVKCACWGEVNEKLGKHGFRLAGSLSALRFSQTEDLPVVRQLPIEKTDGTRLKTGDPKTVNMSFCPFCGTAL